jgi:hypothetical protein
VEISSVLLRESGSGVSLATDAVLLMVPLAVGTTVRKKKKESSLFKVPTLHVTVLPATLQPAGTPRSRACGGKTAVTTTPVAARLGPWFRTFTR